MSLYAPMDKPIEFQTPRGGGGSFMDPARQARQMPPVLDGGWAQEMQRRTPEGPRMIPDMRNTGVVRPDLIRRPTLPPQAQAPFHSPVFNAPRPQFRPPMTQPGFGGGPRFPPTTGAQGAQGAQVMPRPGQERIWDFLRRLQMQNTGMGPRTRVY